MSFARYVAVCVQLYSASFHCLTIHVSAYMAIFRCVVYFYLCLKESASLVFCLSFLSRGHIARFHLCFVPVLFSFVNFVVVSCVYVCLPGFSFVVCFWRLNLSLVQRAQRRWVKLAQAFCLATQRVYRVQWSFI
jgi:hypothetical protein